MKPSDMQQLSKQYHLIKENADGKEDRAMTAEECVRDYNALNDELGAAVKQVDAAVNKMRALMNSSVFEMYANMGWPGIDPQMAEFIYTDFNAWVEDYQDAFRDVIW